MNGVKGKNGFEDDVLCTPCHDDLHASQVALTVAEAACIAPRAKKFVTLKTLMCVVCSADLMAADVRVYGEFTLGPGLAVSYEEGKGPRCGEHAETFEATMFGKGIEEVEEDEHLTPGGR